MEKQKLETCFSPALYATGDHSGSVVVVIDVLRASSAICAAFKNGAESIIPVSDIDTAKEYKSKGYLVAAERDGFVLDFADFGNSPFNFIPEKIQGRTIVYSTTNGTGIIKTASASHKVVIGTFNNISSVTEWLIRQDKPILLFCAGWKNRFNLEDTVCAGAFAEKLMESGRFTTICDSTKAALDLWKMASPDLSDYIGKAAQRTRLRDKGLDDCIEYCLTADNTNVVPIVTEGILIDNNSRERKFDDF